MTGEPPDLTRAPYGCDEERVDCIATELGYWATESRRETGTAVGELISALRERDFEPVGLSQLLGEARSAHR